MTIQALQLSTQKMRLLGLLHHISCWSVVSSLVPLSSTTLDPRGRAKHAVRFPLKRRLHDLRGGGGSVPLFRQRRRAVTTSAYIAGGAAMESSNDKNNNRNAADDEELQQAQRGMSVALAVSYFTVMGAKCALPSVLSLLRDPATGLVFPKNGRRQPDELVSLLLTLSTLAVAMGKLMLGPVIDRFGGIFSLQVALSALGALLAAISVGSSFTSFAVAWIFVDFIFSSCWAGCINAIHQSFPPEQWAGRIGSLAAAARSGNAIAFAGFAAVLKFSTGRIRQTWRPVFAISAAVQVVSVLLLRYYGDKICNYHEGSSMQINNCNTKRPSLRQSLGALSKEASMPEFWLHLVSRSALMVFASFLLFVPTLLCEAYQAATAFGAQAGSIYALGCLLAVTGISGTYTRLPNKGRIAMLIGLLGAATASSVAQLLHMQGTIHLSVTASLVTLFLWGFSFAIPFYSKCLVALRCKCSLMSRRAHLIGCFLVPPSLYALSRVGAKSPATIADVFDIGGFSLLALFNGYVASIEHSRPAAWIPTFKLTTACSAISLVSLSLAVWLEGRRQGNTTKTTQTKLE